MERDETGSWIASERYIAGLLDSGAGHLHPLRYTIGVGKAAIAAGAHLHEHSAVTDIEYGPTVTVQHGEGQRAREVRRALRERRARGPLRAAWRAS